MGGKTRSSRLEKKLKNFRKFEDYDDVLEELAILYAEHTDDAHSEEEKKDQRRGPGKSAEMRLAILKEIKDALTTKSRNAQSLKTANALLNGQSVAAKRGKQAQAWSDTGSPFGVGGDKKKTL